MSKKITSVIYNDTKKGFSEIYVATTDGKLLKYEDRGTAAFDYSYVCQQVRNLLGKVLTVVDASYTNERQLKAVKDIIRNHFAEELSDLWEASESKWEQIIEESSKNLSEEELLKKSVTIEEALGA